MNKLHVNASMFRENLLPLIGLLLCFYFSYHAVSGQRSFFTLFSLERQIETSDAQRDNVALERQNLERKVIAMRPGSLNRDLLEERVAAVLGYQAADEVRVLSN
ncbi:MAG: FtsB family cell division protein [Bdellovibrionales bacterium]